MSIELMHNGNLMKAFAAFAYRVSAKMPKEGKTIDKTKQNKIT